MTTARCYAGGAVAVAADVSAHRMLVVGGQDTVFLDSCELYDAVADRWSMQEARLPQAMRCRAAPLAGRSAVLALQWSGNEKTRCALLDVRSCSPSWQPMASPESARSCHAIAALGECSMVMLGGFNTGQRSTETAQMYDARADRWSERAEWRLPATSGSHCAVLVA